VDVRVIREQQEALVFKYLASLSANPVRPNQGTLDTHGFDLLGLSPKDSEIGDIPRMTPHRADLMKVH
jgi:hypothetical protein